MAQYIDKSAIAAEIESYKLSFCDRNGYLEDVKTNGIAYDTLVELEDSIDTLEIKEIDNHWKPSDEQIEALNAMILNGDLSYVNQNATLIKLYNDLKKLKD